MTIKNFIERAGYYFNLMPDKEDEQTIVAQITEGVSFRGANLWVLIFAIFIASLGLNVNSTAVIIGAMLISPLMGPIVGHGAGCRHQSFRPAETRWQELRRSNAHQCADRHDLFSPHTTQRGAVRAAGTHLAHAL